MGMIESNIGMAWIEQALKYMIQEHGFEEARRKIMNKPQLWGLLLQIVGDETAPPVPGPPSQLRPFSTRGNDILLNGVPFRFTGYNLRELAWYDGSTAQTQHTDWNFALHQLRVAKDLGGKVIRLYAAHTHFTVQQAIPRVINALDAIAAHGLYAIVALTDGVHSGFSLKDTEQNFRGRHTHEFYAGGYQQHYLPYVRTMVEAIGDHPAIMIWEPGNEFLVPFPMFVPTPPTDKQYDNVLNFFRVASDTIREAAPTKLIGTGLVSARELFADHAYGGRQLAKQLYALPNIDCASVHTYEGQRTHRWGDTGFNLEAEMNLQGHPIYIGETGMNLKQPQLNGGFTAQLGAETSHRVSGVCQWALHAWGSDRGVGDLDAGMNQFQPTAWHHLTGAMEHLARNVYR